jgi:hypothetical protein
VITLRTLTGIVVSVAFTALGQDTTFRAVDLYIDSGAQPLAAYQLTFYSTDANVKIVGIEGGEHRAFSDAPYYDPQAMRTNHVIIAAFSTASADQLPRGRTHVATVHLRIPSGHASHHQLKVEAAATPSAERISVIAEAKERTPL